MHPLPPEPAAARSGRGRLAGSACCDPPAARPEPFWSSACLMNASIGFAFHRGSVTFGIGCRTGFWKAHHLRSSAVIAVPSTVVDGAGFAAPPPFGRATDPVDPGFQYGDFLLCQRRQRRHRHYRFFQSGHAPVEPARLGIPGNDGRPFISALQDVSRVRRSRPAIWTASPWHWDTSASG